MSESVEIGGTSDPGQQPIAGMERLIATASSWVGDRTMRRRLMRFSGALSIAAAAAATTITLATTTMAHAATFSTSNGVCPIITASQWQLPYAPYTKGTQYDVHVKGYSCAMADGYIKQLVTHKVSNCFPTCVKGGPSGWQCTGVAKQDRPRLHRAVLKARKYLQRTLFRLDCWMRSATPHVSKDSQIET